MTSVAAAEGVHERRVMNDNEIEQQIERCRRLASMITDTDVRRSLEELAAEYEAQRSDGPSDSFMLRPENRAP